MLKGIHSMEFWMLLLLLVIAAVLGYEIWSKG
jgi:hypothetical protein